MSVDVLLVEDATELAESTAEYLAAFGLTTQCEPSGEAAMAWLGAHAPRVVVLDVNLPGMSGFEFCRRFRQEHDTPVIFLSARRSDDDQILGLSIGGDDWLRKPYPLSVLLARIRRTLARAATICSDPPEQVFDDGRLVVDAVAGRVWVAGAEIRVKAMEYRLLTFLVAHRGRVVTKADLFANVWQNAVTGDGTLSVHIRRLRTHIEQDPDNPRYIKTVWGRGYMFTDGP